MSGIQSRGRPHHTTVPNWRLEDPDLDSQTLHVAAWIASHTHDYCTDYVTRNEIARRTGVSTPSVSRRLTRLVELGIIEIEQGSRGRFVVTFDYDVWQDRPERYVPVTGTESTGDRNAPSQSAELHLYIGETQGEEQTEERWFDVFWVNYPNKVGKPAALKAYRGAMKRASREAVIVGLSRWCHHWEAAGTAQKFIPHPATWLNQDRWNDDCPPVVSGDTRSQRSMAAIERLAARGDRPVPTLEEAFREIER